MQSIRRILDKILSVVFRKNNEAENIDEYYSERKNEGIISYNQNDRELYQKGKHIDEYYSGIQKDAVSSLKKREIELSQKEQKIDEKIRILKEEILSDKKNMLSERKRFEDERKEFKEYEENKVQEIENKSKLIETKLKQIENRMEEEGEALEYIKKENEKLEKNKRDFRNYVGKRQLELSLKRAKFEREREKFEIEMKKSVDRSNLIIRKVPKTKKVQNVARYEDEIVPFPIKEHLEMDIPATDVIYEDHIENDRNYDNNYTLVEEIKSLNNKIETEMIQQNPLSSKMQKMGMDFSELNEKEKENKPVHTVDPQDLKYHGNKWVPLPFDVED